MRLLLLLLALGSILWSSAPVEAVDRIPTLFRSVALLRVGTPDGEGLCTAWSLHEQHRLWATAGHCAEPEYTLKVDGFPARLLLSDAPADLAVLYVSGTRVPALRLRTTAPRIGDHLRVAGYIDPDQGPILLTVFLASHQFPGPVRGKPVLITAGNFVKGMSGGPVVDRDNRVVSVVQSGGHPASERQELGAGSTQAETLRALAPYASGEVRAPVLAEAVLARF